MTTCSQCKGSVVQPVTGRPRRFCSDRCRKAFGQRVRTLRSQIARCRHLAAVNPEPYSSMWAERQAVAQAELTRLAPD